MELIIIRHGRPEHVEPGDLVAGAEPADPPLADIGHRQAERVAAHLVDHGVDAVVSSPLLRARQTAAPLAERLGVEPTVVDGVAEYDRHDGSYVPAEITRERIRAGAVDDATAEQWRDPLSALETAERDVWVAGVVAGFRTIIADHPGRRVAVFCHGMVTSAWFAHVLGLDQRPRFVLDYAGIARMLASGSTEAVTIRSFNETHHLGDDHIPLFEK